MALYHSQPYGNHDPLGELVKPPRAIDESSFREQKSDLLREPCSQDDWLSKIQGMDAYVNAMLELNEQVGPWFGCELAEGWNRHNPLGFAPSDFDAMRNLPLVPVSYRENIRDRWKPVSLIWTLRDS